MKSVRILFVRTKLLLFKESSKNTFCRYTFQRSLTLSHLIPSSLVSKTTDDISKSIIKKFKLSIRMSSSNSETSLIVEHVPSFKKFSIKLGEAEAKLEYVKKGDVLNMWHTEVPPALQGKGIAKLLAQEAFSYAVKNNLKMLLSCTYLQKFYKDNPKEEYKSLVVSS